MPYVLSAMMSSMLVTIILLHGVLSLKLFGWNSGRGLLYLISILIGVFGVYWIYLDLKNGPLQIVGTVAVLALGLVVGGAVGAVTAKPRRWPRLCDVSLLFAYMGD